MKAAEGLPAERDPAPLRVAVGIITYRRPRGLARLLDSLSALTFADKSPALEIVVVDNDPEQLGRAVCLEAQKLIKWPIRYEVEGRRGIPHARNTVVRSSLGHNAFIAFIDDDEVADPRWLDALLEVQRRSEADVVTGPVISRFEGPVPSWLLRGGFFERVRHPTGTSLTVARTGNVLIRASVFSAVTPAFDERLALTGGSDTHFFLRAVRAGFKLVWADEAVVYEWVSGRRMNTNWLLRRSFRIGNTRGVCDRDLERSWRVRTVAGLTAIGWIGKGFALVPVSCLRGRHALIEASRRIFKGAGYLAGIAGYRFDEYRHTDGN